MNKKIQQRIVGSIAVIALLILVLPHLFSSNVPTIPARVDDQSNSTDTFSRNQNNIPDDYNSAVISVPLIPTLNDDNNTEANDIDPQVEPLTAETPVNENIWNHAITQPTTSPINSPNTEIVNNNDNSSNTNTSPIDTDTQLSVAEKLLAEAQSVTNNTTANNPVELPKIELIGSTQLINTKAKPTPNIELIGSTQSGNTKTATVPQTQNVTQPKFTWYIQVGSYASKENANKVMSDYRKKGYPSEVAFLSGQYKVRIGPLKTQNNARNVQAELKRNGINSYIIQIQ